MTDGQLLDSFASGGDERAFGELVIRHGPVVLRRCRKVLANEHDAEDACQATFQVLHRRALSLRESEWLGGWLLGVAYRVGVRMRRRASMRSRLEGSRVERPYEWLRPEDSLEELGRVVCDEVDRLPATYRRAVSLCYLEGLTHREAASRLGCPLGTVKVRLVRARRLMRRRLASLIAVES
jgi:RNA polymerase sigma factor (sigma-70 family)